MQRARTTHEGLISWLKYFDIEYIGDDLCNALAQLDINQTSERCEAIRLAIEPEFKALNDISKNSMRKVLEAALAAPEQELEAIFARVGMPFQAPVHSRIELLSAIWRMVFNHAGA